MGIARRYVMTAQTVTRRLPKVLQARGLDAGVLKSWYLTIDRDEVWLFADLDIRRVERLERYTTKALVHQLSTVCDGTPVVISNSSGLRYCLLLSQRPRLPRAVEFPGCKRGYVRLGIGQSGRPLAVQWKGLGHLLVAGMTDSGKSNFLRLLVHQALAEGMQLLLADVDGATFPMLAEHPALLAPIAGTPDEALTIAQRGLAECDRRAALYKVTPNFPENLDEYNAETVKLGGDPLPRVVVVLDEYNATAVAHGGNRSRFAHDVASLGWRGRKFGLHLVFAAQDFTKAIVGRVRDQVKAVICFKVRSTEAARNVGTAGAEKISANTPGRAVTDLWGVLQAYYLDKSLLIRGRDPDILTAVERALVGWGMRSNGGYLSLADIQEHANLTPYAARKLGEEWERKGWLKKDTDAANKRYITDKLRLLFNTLQTAQTGANQAVERQTERQTDRKPNVQG